MVVLLKDDCKFTYVRVSADEWLEKYERYYDGEWHVKTTLEYVSFEEMMNYIKQELHDGFTMI